MLNRYRENGGTKVKDEDEEDAAAEPKVGGTKHEISFFLQLPSPCYKAYCTPSNSFEGHLPLARPKLRKRSWELDWCTVLNNMCIPGKHCNRQNGVGLCI